MFMYGPLSFSSVSYFAFILLYAAPYTHPYSYKIVVNRLNVIWGGRECAKYIVEDMKVDKERKLR